MIREPDAVNPTPSSILERISFYESRDSRRGLLTLMAFVAYAIVVAVVIFYHEPWRDEADSWLLARDASVSQILERMPYAGTPALWYFVLLPFAKSGFPYVTQAVVNGIFMLSAVWLLLFRSPFAALQKILFAFSFYLAYEYSVIARSYGLSVLLIFLIAVIWAERLRRPLAAGFLIALLANTNSHSFLFAGLLFAILLYDTWNSGVLARRPFVLGLTVGAGGLIAAFLQLQVPQDASARIQNRPSDFSQPFEAIAQAFVPTYGSGFGTSLGVIVLVLVVVDLLEDRRSLTLLFTYTLLLFSLFVFVWAGGLRHYGFLFLVVVFVLWTRSADLQRRGAVRMLARAALVVALCVSGAISMAVTATTIVDEVRLPFSGAREMGEFIKERGLQTTIIAAHFATQAESVLPYFDKKTFWYAGVERFGSYMTWDREYEAGLNVHFPEAVRRVEVRFRGIQSYLLLLSAEMPDPEDKGYRLLFATDPRVFGHGKERFFLYVPLPVKASTPDSSTSQRLDQ